MFWKGFRKTTGKQIAPSRSLEVAGAYLQRGQTVSRSLWVKVSPTNPLLKALAAIPLGALFLVMFIFMMVVLGFALLAVALMAATSRSQKEGTE